MKHFRTRVVVAVLGCVGATASVAAVGFLPIVPDHYCSSIVLDRHHCVRSDLDEQWMAEARQRTKSMLLSSLHGTTMPFFGPYLQQARQPQEIVDYQHVAVVAVLVNDVSHSRYRRMKILRHYVASEIPCSVQRLP